MVLLINWFCFSGIISVIFYLLHDIIGAKNYPRYNWLSQAVSDLTATDAPSFIKANGYLSLYKIFNCICCSFLCILIQNQSSEFLRIGIYFFATMNFISAIGYSLFPLSSSGYDGTFQSFVHVYIVTLLVVLLSIVSLILIAIGSVTGKENHLYLGIIAILSLVLMCVGAIGTGTVSKRYFGVFERFSTYSAVIFTGILGLYGLIVF